MKSPTVEIIAESVDKLNEHIKDTIDKEFIVKECKVVLERLKAKKESGEKLSLSDIKDIMKIYRNVYIPAAMKQESDKLNTVKALIDNYSRMSNG